MAVYKRNYRRYDGSLTGPRWRFMILPRYAFATVFESRFFTSFFTICFVPHLVAMFLIYVKHNIAAFQAMNLPTLQFLAIDGNFFLTLFSVETFLSFFVVSLVGPGLIAPDLGNNAMPLYLSRPFSRWEYIAGKLSVLLAMTSLITWIPGLIVVGVQVNMAGFSWLRQNPGLPIGVLVGSWVWIMTISLIALAISAWVKLKPIATASLFGVFFALAAFGQVANNILELRPRWGSLLSLPTTMSMIWTWLLFPEEEYRQYLVRSARLGVIPIGAAFAAMLAVCGVALFLLIRKIRGSEVIRG